MKKQMALGRLSLLLCCVLLLSSFLGLNSFAASFTNLVTDQRFSSWTRNIITGSAPVLTYSDNVNKVDYSNKTNANIVMYSYTVNGIVPSDNYQFSFEWMGWGARMPFVAYIELLDSSGNVLDTSPGNFEASETITEYHIVSSNFRPQDILVNQNDRPVSIQIHFVFSPRNSYDKCWINVRNISLIDTDEDVETGLLEGIKDWLSRVYHSIAGGTDSQGVYHQGIVVGIVLKLQDVKDGFVNALNNVKTAITNAIAGIQQWFTDLGDNIAGFFDDLWENLKRLFIPQDGFFSNKFNEFKQWASEHFGFLYQSGDLMVNVFTAIKDMLSSDRYTMLSFPNIELDLVGEHIFFDFSSANSSLAEVLQSSTFANLYTLYKTALAIAFGLALTYYALDVFDRIMAN